MDYNTNNKLSRRQENWEGRDEETNHSFYVSNLKKNNNKNMNYLKIITSEMTKIDNYQGSMVKEIDTTVQML